MFTDYDIYTGIASTNSNTHTWEGTNQDGVPIVHSTLANPLANGGTYARRFRHTPQPSQTNIFDGGQIFASPNSGVASGAYIAPDNTKALDIRFTARDDASTPQHSNIGVANRYQHSTSFSNGGTPEAFDGYGMRFGPIQNNAFENHNGNGNNPAVQYVGLFARFQMEQFGNNNAQFTDVNIDTNPVTSGPWLQQTWYRFRYRFVPTTNLLATLYAHVLNNITADETVEANWVQVATLDVVASRDRWYIPFAAGQRVGFYTAINGGTSVPQMLVDNITFAIATVP